MHELESKRSAFDNVLQSKCESSPNISFDASVVRIWSKFLFEASEDPE